MANWQEIVGTVSSAVQAGASAFSTVYGAINSNGSNTNFPPSNQQTNNVPEESGALKWNGIPIWALFIVGGLGVFLLVKKFFN